MDSKDSVRMRLYLLHKVQSFANEMSQWSYQLVSLKSEWQH